MEFSLENCVTSTPSVYSTCTVGDIQLTLRFQPKTDRKRVMSYTIAQMEGFKPYIMEHGSDKSTDYVMQLAQNLYDRTRTNEDSNDVPT